MRNLRKELKETMKNIVNEDLTHLLPKISVPTLLFWGSLDTATPISDGRKMEKLIPDCGLIEYAGSTHFSYLENINNCNAVLNEFAGQLASLVHVIGQLSELVQLV